MSHKLCRTDGNLIRSFKLVEHNKPTCDAELWYYGFDELNCYTKDYIVWYKHEGKWEILVAGPEAYRRYGDSK